VIAAGLVLPLAEQWTGRETHLTRLETALTDLAGKVGRRPYTTKATVERRLAAILARQPARQFVTARVEEGVDDDPPEAPPTLRLVWAHDAAALAAAAALDGRYVLGANDPSLDPEHMLASAKRRDVPEKRFALVKGPLAIRPVYLHKQERIQALVFCTMVALLVFALLELLAHRAGFAAEEYPDLALSRGETVGTARMGRKEVREAFGERSAGAIRAVAIEPPQSQFEADLLSRRRQIRRPPRVVAMHGVAATAAIWATATGKLSVCCDTQMSRIKRGHLLDAAPRERTEFIHFSSKMVAAAATAIARPLRPDSTQSAEEPSFWTLPGASYYEERYKQRVLASLRRRAKSLGYVLQAADATPPDSDNI